MPQNIVFNIEHEQKRVDKVRSTPFVGELPATTLRLVADGFGNTYTRLLKNNSVIQSLVSEHVYEVLEGLNPTSVVSSYLARFSTVNHTTSTYLPNPFFLFDHLDLTGAHVWDSNGGVSRRGALISNRLLLGAAHVPPQIGSTFRFINSDGVKEERTVLDVVLQPNNYTPVQDMALALLSAPLSNKVKPFRLCMWDIINPYLDSISTGTYKFRSAFEIPGSMLHYNRNNMIGVIGNETYNNPNIWAKVSQLVPLAANGDSGSPVFIHFNGNNYLERLVSVTFGDGTSVTSSSNRAILQSMLDTLNTRNNTNEVLTDYSSDFTNINPFNFEQ